MCEQPLIRADRPDRAGTPSARNGILSHSDIAERNTPMSIRALRRRTTLLVAATAVATAAAAGGLTPSAAWADTSGPCASFSSVCPVGLVVMSGGNLATNSLTVPWAAPSALPDSLLVDASANIMMNPDLPDGGYLNVSMDGNLLATSTTPLCDQGYYCQGESIGDDFGYYLSATQYEAIPFGTHTFLGGFTAGSQTWYSQPVTVTFEPPPDGTLIQDATTGQVAVVAGGQRVVLPNPQYLNPATITSMPDSAYQSLPAAPNGTLIRNPQGAVYEIVDGYALPFVSVADLNSSGLDTADIHDVSGPVPGTFPVFNKLPNGTLIHDNATEADSVMAGGAQVQFLNWAEVTAAGITSQSQFIDVPPSYFSSLPTMPAPGTYVQGDASPQVYLIHMGMKTAVTTPAGVTPVVVSQSWLDTVRTTG
jgi:hypothetical protein